MDDWKLAIGIACFVIGGLFLFTINSSFITGGHGLFGLENILPHWMFPPEQTPTNSTPGI